MNRNFGKLMAFAAVFLMVFCFPVYVGDDSAASDATGDIGYDSLTVEGKAIYDKFETGVQNKDFNLKISDRKDVTALEFQKIQFAYQSDHPDMFWASYYDYIEEGADGTYVKVKRFDPSKFDLDRMYEQLADRVKSISIGGDSMGAKVKSIQDAVTDTVEYDEGTINSSNAYGVFVEHRAKCDGYSIAIAYLCKANGIDALCVIGYVKELGEEKGAHAWNIIRMDDDRWYILDATWDDVSSRLQRYDYFLIGTETRTPSGTMSDTRHVHYDYGKNISADKYNYDPLFLEHMLMLAVVAVVIVVLAIVAFRYYRGRKKSTEPIEEVFDRYELQDHPAEEEKKEEENENPPPEKI